MVRSPWNRLWHSTPRILPSMNLRCNPLLPCVPPHSRHRLRTLRTSHWKNVSIDVALYKLTRYYSALPNLWRSAVPGDRGMASLEGCGACFCRTNPSLMNSGYCTAGNSILHSPGSRVSRTKRPSPEKRRGDDQREDGSPSICVQLPVVSLWLPASVTHTDAVWLLAFGAGGATHRRTLMRLGSAYVLACV